MMEIGDPLPEAAVTMADGAVRSLAGWACPLVVWFYPKDDTAGCTREALDFTAHADAFAAAGVQLLGLSRGTAEGKARFAAKHALAVPLAADGDGAAGDAFGVWGERSLYGRTYMGLERATFLFGPDRRLARAWRRVRVPGHVEAVLAAARGL